MPFNASADKDLLRRFRETGDREALSALFERHRALAYRVALGVLGERADAEDAAQDAFLNLLRYEPRMYVDQSLAGLVARMALRSAQHLARAGGRRRAREAAWAAAAGEPEEDAFEVVAEQEARRDVRCGVEALEDSYRVPILLHYFEGLSTQETAQALGISPGAARTRLSRAVARLRERLQRDGRSLAVPALVALLQPRTAEAAPATLAARLDALAAGASLSPPAATGVAGLAGGGMVVKLAGAALVVVLSLGGIGTLRRMPPPTQVEAQAGDPHPPAPSPARRARGSRRGPSAPSPAQPRSSGSRRPEAEHPSPPRARREGASRKPAALGPVPLAAAKPKPAALGPVPSAAAKRKPAARTASRPLASPATRREGARTETSTGADARLPADGTEPAPQTEVAAAGAPQTEQKPAEPAPAGEPAPPEALDQVLRGLDARDAAITAIDGVLVDSIQYSPEYIEMEKASFAKVGVTRALDTQAVRVAKFAVHLTRNSWRIDTVDLLSAGLEDWGMSKSPYPGIAVDSAGRVIAQPRRTEVAAAGTRGEVRPTTVSMSDGEFAETQQVHLGYGTRKRFDPKLYGSLPVLETVLNRTGVFVGGERFGRWFRGLTAPPAQVKVRTVQEGGEKCYRVALRGRVHDEPSDHAFELVLWFAPERGYAVVRMESSGASEDNPKSGSRSLTLFSDFVPVEGGMQLPTTCTRYQYSCPPAKAYWSRAERAVFQRLRANGAMTQLDFAWRFPLGTLLMEDGKPMHDPDIPVDLAPLLANLDPTGLPEHERYSQPLMGDEFADLLAKPAR